MDIMELGAIGELVGGSLCRSSRLGVGHASHGTKFPIFNLKAPDPA